MMQFTTKIGLKKHVKDRSKQTEFAEIILNDQPTQLIIEGVYLEAAIKLSAQPYLLLVTHDIPFEETLDLILFDAKEKRILDSLWIGLMYETGNLENLYLQDNFIHFDFLRQMPWRLSISEQSRFRFPIAIDAMIHRPFRLLTYLHLK